ncbi:MobH family relaxase (plasmid) [Microbulbifer sp. TRSA002]|uniref:MobH family relaxase n=1 Tax=Microbulbifer sp. TRSA002 TaxID=3243382 RepID=UPI004039403E
MLITLFKRKRNKSDVETAPSKYAQAKSGKELLEPPKRSTLIRKIKRLFSITEDVWNNHYLFAIERFAELVQEVPASEIHHHSKEGGLIDHTLEALHAGIRVAQGYVLPPNSEPEHIASSSDRWRFGAFIAILTHDIGKVVTDIEIVYRERGGEFQHWHPWYGSIPTGAEYSYRYKKRISNSKIAKSLHEKAAMSLLPRLLTKKAAQWIFEDTELLAQLFNTVTHSTFGGQAIAEIVRVADSASVAKNLGAETGKKTDHSTAIPLHKKLIVSLRKLITDGDLKRNKPGAAVWVTDSDTWVVSKATMEAVRVQLLNEGHRGIPQNVVRLFEVLNDHDLLIKNPHGESVWTAEINDFAKNWQQRLTFLRFKNEIIWPTSNPEKFDGEVLPVDKSGNIIEGTQTPENLNVVEKSAKLYLNMSTDKAITNTLKSKPKKTILPESVLSKLDKQNAIDNLQGKGETKKHIANATAERNHERDPVLKKSLSEDKGQIGISSHEAKNLKNTAKKIQKELIKQNDFLTWLLKGISRRQIRVNESKAPVHILDSHVALVTPVIFNLFLDKNSLKKRLYEKRAGDKKVYTLLQKELESLGIHQRSSSGQNIVRVTVEGHRSQSELRVYLLNRDYFPSLSNFSTNKAMTINM